MTRSNNRRTVLFASALALSAAAGAHAHEWGGHAHGNMMFGLLDGVTLSDTQQQQVHTVMQSGFAATRSTRQALRALDEQISSAMLSPGTVSTASLTPLLQQQERLRAQLDQERLSVALQVRQVLTASQLAQAAQAHSQLAGLHQQEESIAHPGGTAE